VDLHIVGGEPTAEERDAVDALLGPPESGWAGGTRDSGRDGRASAGGRSTADARHLLLPAFHAVQDRVGWVSRGAMNHICRRLSVPPADAWGVLTFYHLLATEPRPRAVAHVCDDIACRLRGAEALCREMEARLGPPLHGGGPGAPHVPEGEVGGVGDAGTGMAARAWQRSPCLGQCDAGSAALVLRAGPSPERFVLAPVRDADALVRALDGQAPEPGARILGGTGRARLLARVGKADPADLESYRAAGGYRALARAIELGPDGVITEIAASRLLGRGGAAFPAARKWEAVRQQEAMPHYVVCNADESEPGTFKDRVVLEGDPFAVIEAMTICGLATASRHGFVYIRGEYPLAEARLRAALAAARAANLLGSAVMGSGSGFDIEIRRGGGAYICGEETALFNSIEGKRGEPRSKPPFPAEVGLFGKPTVANNVETLVNVIDILLEGGRAWAQTGTADSTGPRLFCLSGHVARPGVYEVPFGTTLQEVIDLAGGVAGGRAVQAVLLGGAAGTFVGPESLALPLTFDAARAAGATLGSGVVMVFDETADIGDALTRMAAFFRQESCGQCVPCRVGTVRQQALLHAMLAPGEGDGRQVACAVHAELAAAMKDASICGLGHTASSAIESALRLGLVQGEPRP
jgi:NADH-quinone oxidoreductase subunit F